MFGVVTAGAPGVVHIVAGPLQGSLHRLIGHPPVAAVEVVVVLAALEVDAQGLGLEFAHEDGELVGTVDADVGADAAEDAPEAVGPVPGGHEGADAAAADAGDGGIVGVGAELEAVLGLDGGEEFVDEEAAVGVADAVVFIAAVVAREGVGVGGGDDTGLDEDANERGDLSLGDEVVEDDGGVVDDAVLEDHEGPARRLAEVVGGGKVDRVVAFGAGKDAAFLRGVGAFDEFAFRDVGLRDGVRTGLVVVLSLKIKHRQGGEGEDQEVAHGEMASQFAPNRKEKRVLAMIS